MSEVKRLSCTVSDKRGINGDCMEISDSGRYIKYSDFADIKLRNESLINQVAILKMASESGASALKLAGVGLGYSSDSFAGAYASKCKKVAGSIEKVLATIGETK